MIVEQLLTPEELHALLSQPEPVFRQELDGAPRPYALVSPENGFAPLMPVIESIHERFAHRLQILLFELLRLDVEVVPEKPRLVACTDFLTSMRSPCSMTLLQMGSLDGPAVWALEREFVFYAVDVFFGGNGRSITPLSENDFSGVELRMTQRLSAACTTALEAAWQPFHALTVKAVGHETRPRFLTALNPAHTLVCCTVICRWSQVEVKGHIVLPLSALEPVRAPLRQAMEQDRPSPDPALRRKLRDRVQDSPVEMRCVLAQTQLTLRELLNLGVGDVITMEIPQLAQLEVSGVPLVRGRCGVARGWRAVAIEETYLQSPDGVDELEALSA